MNFEVCSKVTVELADGYKINVKIEQDTDAESPREWDNLGTMVCFHSRYNLGDKHKLSIDEARALQKRKDIISLPLYLYDHSGITMRTTKFECPWDSGCVGFIYVTTEDVRKEYSVKRVSKKLRAKVVEILRGEVTTYDQYLTGDVYGYSIDVIDESTGDEVENESCWGFFGCDYIGKEVRDIVHHLMAAYGGHSFIKEELDKGCTCDDKSCFHCWCSDVYEKNADKTVATDLAGYIFVKYNEREDDKAGQLELDLEG